MLAVLLALAQAPEGLPELPPTAGLDPAAAPFHARAEAEERAGRFAAAAGFYRLVLVQDPAYVPARLGLARSLEGQGALAEAEAIYREMPTEPDAVEALARLVARRDPREALALWRRLETLRLGDPTPFREQARLLADADPDAALAAWRRYREQLLGAPPEPALGLAIADALVRAGRAAEAEALLREQAEASPDAEAEVRSRLDRLEVERLAAALVLPAGEALDAEGRAALEAVGAELAAGNLASAEARARALVAASPRSAAAHGVYADVLRARGEWRDAEIHAVQARALGAGDAAHHLRLGALLVEAYGGRRDEEAAECYREAAALRPGDPEVLAALAAVEQRLGDWGRAEAAWAEVARLGEGAPAERARAELEKLGRVAPVLPQLAAGDVVPPAAAGAYRVALVYLRRGELDRALEELDRAEAAAPGEPTLLNLRARLLRQRGDEAGAVAALERSLAADPGQGPAELALGEIALARGDREEARRRFRRAADRGVGDAHYLLARLAADDGDWEGVRTGIAAFDAAAGGASLYAASAAALRGEVERRRRLERGLWTVLAGVGVGVPLVVWLRRRSAADLRTVLDRAPGLRHDAARRLAALRHEVLKHRTTVLPEVADALERGDRGPWEEWAAQSADLRARFDTLLADLTELAARAGLRADLRRDPVLGPMHRALAALSGRRPPTPARVRAAGDALNRVGYAAIGRLLAEIGVLALSPGLVREVYERVAREPGIRGAPVPPLDVVVRAPGAAVRLFREDLDDILANLLRNAVAAGAARLVVTLDEGLDPVTAHPWVQVRVADDAPGAVTNAMIRSRAISRGLGLAVDLLNRHGGSIRVEPDAVGKAIVVELPGVEAARVEVEEG